jgi:hypothetical protein
VSLKGFSDPDALLLRGLIQKYGLDGFCHELMMIIKSWKNQAPKKWSQSFRAAFSLEYQTRLALGSAILPEGCGKNK